MLFLQHIYKIELIEYRMKCTFSVLHACNSCVMFKRGMKGYIFAKYQIKNTYLFSNVFNNSFLLMMYRERFITDIHHIILWLVTINLIHE